MIVVTSLTVLDCADIIELVKKSTRVGQRPCGDHSAARRTWLQILIQTDTGECLPVTYPDAPEAERNGQHIFTTKTSCRWAICTILGMQKWKNMKERGE